MYNIPLLFPLPNILIECNAINIIESDTYYNSFGMSNVIVIND